MQGRPSYGGNDARCVIGILGGKTFFFQIACNAVPEQRWPVSHDQTVYITCEMRLADCLTERVIISVSEDHVGTIHFTYSSHLHSKSIFDVIL